MIFITFKSILIEKNKVNFDNKFVFHRVFLHFVDVFTNILYISSAKYSTRKININFALN